MVSRVALVRLKLTDESDLLDALVMQNSSSFLFKLRNNISLASCTDNVADANRYIECASSFDAVGSSRPVLFYILYLEYGAILSRFLGTGVPSRVTRNSYGSCW